jgi:hypothetical protein
MRKIVILAKQLRLVGGDSNGLEAGRSMNIAVLLSGESELDHLGIERGGFQAEELCGTVFSTNAPSSFFQYAAHMLALCITVKQAGSRLVGRDTGWGDV